MAAWLLLCAVLVPALARAADLPETVDPALCTVAPLEPDALVALAAATPAAAPATGTRSDEQVPTDILTAVTETIRMSVACTNANQPMRGFALFTPRWLAERFGGPAGQDDLGHLLSALTRDPAVAPEADRLTLFSITDARLAGDGAVTVTVETGNRSATFLDEVTLREIDGRWLIDAVRPPVPTGGTPTA